jgi:hypothetical protein
MNKIVTLLLSTMPLLAASPFQATGFKVGEVTDNSAILWTRLTLEAKPNPASAPTLTFQYSGGETLQPDLKKRPKHPPTRLNGIKYTTKGGVNDIRYAAPGVRGEVRILYSAEIKAPSSP